MCGLAAIFKGSAQKIPPFDNMLDVIRHRGPDDEGWVAFCPDSVWPICGGGADTPADCYDAGFEYAPAHGVRAPENTSLILGHRRLSILDLSHRGHQPMSFENGRYWIVYNGEIYNNLELKAELEDFGYQFHSDTDTEVILAAFSAWNIDAVRRLEGMFTFIIFDRKNNKLLAVRDRFGIKPLYYWISPDGFLAFASEIKQFTTLPNWCPRVNGQRAYDFLCWGLLDHTDETLFAGVYQLGPGTMAQIDLDLPLDLTSSGKLKIEKWYTLSPSEFDGSFKNASKQFQNLFTKSIEAHLRSDVAIGSCLSGGLDSSAIVCSVAEYYKSTGDKNNQIAVSSCSKIPKFDERKYVQDVAVKTGIDAHYIYPTPDKLFEQLPLITWHQDEPFGSTSVFAQWSVFEKASSLGIKVMLDGQGADEQLGGYRGYHGVRFIDLFRRYKWIDLLCEILATYRVHKMNPLWAVKYIADVYLPLRVRYFFRDIIGREVASPNWLDLDKLSARAIDPFRSGTGAPKSMRDLSERQLMKSNLQMLLHWEDRDSMAHSIEARVPFLDRALVEFSVGLPDAYKLNRGVTKRVLRESMSGILPTSVQKRMTKLGFATAEQTWITQDAAEEFRKFVEEAISTSNGLIKKDFLNFFDDVVSGARPFDFTVWRVVSFVAWMKQFRMQLP